MWGTTDDDYGDLRLQAGSPAITYGNNGGLPTDAYDLDKDANTAETIPYDLDGNDRVVNSKVDLGVYEYEFIGTPPVSNAGNDQSVNTMALVTLDGSGSSDPDNNLPLVYSWTQTQGPGVTLSDATAVNPTFTSPSNPAVLAFSLTVTDSVGLVDNTPDQVVITVNNQAPVANAGPDQSVTVSSVVTLDGTSSSDPDGDLPLTYLWLQTGEPTVILSSNTAAMPTFTAPSDPTALTSILLVTDHLGLIDSTPDGVTITVNPPPTFYVYLPLIHK